MNQPTGQHREATGADRPGFINRAILFIACALVFSAGAVAWPCPAQGVFTESFDTDTATTQQTLEAYPFLSLSRPTQGLAVRDGVLTTLSGPRVMLSLPRLSTGPAVISLDIGAADDRRGSSVVVEVMQTNIVFHPGWSSGGGFRVDGVFSNTDMGFVPAIGVMHHMTIRTDGAGHFDVEVVDGSDPNNVYKVSFDNPKAQGNELRLQSGNRAMLFDNIRIDSVLPPQAEPEAIAPTQAEPDVIAPAPVATDPPPATNPDWPGSFRPPGFDDEPEPDIAPPHQTTPPPPSRAVTSANTPTLDKDFLANLARTVLLIAGVVLALIIVLAVALVALIILIDLKSKPG